MSGDLKIALVSMPFASLGPSPQLGALKSLVHEAGFDVETFHLNIDLARLIGVREYESLTEHRGVLVGDWLFAQAAFGEATPDRAGRFLKVFSDDVKDMLEPIGKKPRWLKRLRDITVPQYLDGLLREIDWSEYRVVGFTSTFQQNAASFALAAALKARHPRLITVFGGSNFEADMGRAWVAAIRAADYIVVGEGEKTLPELLQAIETGADPAQVPGVTCLRDGISTVPKPRAMFADLSALPYADYDEYFKRSERYLPELPRFAAIPFQSARGCWWGAKHHCTFCGLNGTTMTFRSKSAVRLIGELKHYAQRYAVTRFESVDNILDHRYFDTFLPALIDQRLNFKFFFEVKANLDRADLQLLSRAGVDSIQPGIESLSTHVLALMKKGITAAANVNTLRWATYYHINTSWNILYGFPGETLPDYENQTSLAGCLTHLQPPATVSRLWLERFSPLFKTTVRKRRPTASYAYVYPNTVDLNQAAYFFEGELSGTVLDADVSKLVEQVENWRQAWKAPEKPTFSFTIADGEVAILDRRAAGREEKLHLNDLEGQVVCAASDRPTSLTQLCSRLSVASDPDRVAETVENLCRGGVLMRDGERLLTLPLPAHERPP